MLAWQDWWQLVQPRPGASCMPQTRADAESASVLGGQEQRRALSSASSHTSSAATHAVQMAQAEEYHSVVVVGAGISGLYAAQLLRRQYPDLLVVEAQERVGGRIMQVSATVVACSFSRAVLPAGATSGRRTSTRQRRGHSTASW